MEKRLKEALAVSPDEASKAKKMLEPLTQDVNNQEQELKKGSKRGKKLADEVQKPASERRRLKPT